MICSELEDSALPPKSNDLVLQLCGRDVNQVILAGMAALHVTKSKG